MHLAFFAAAIAATALALDAQPSTVDPGASCKAAAGCKAKAYKLGGASVSIVTDDADNMTTFTIDLGGQSFELYDIDRSDNHHSVTHQLEKVRAIHVTAGTLADGSKAAVVVLDIDDTTVRESDYKHLRLDHEARVAVCDLAKATCSRPQDLTCSKGGCTAKLAKGTLTVASKPRQTFTITP